VTRSAPFHRTRESGTNPLPLTVNVAAGLPTRITDGLKPVSVGGGFVGSLVPHASSARRRLAMPEASAARERAE
jgi:hypothetical protein